MVVVGQAVVRCWSGASFVVGETGHSLLDRRVARVACRLTGASSVAGKARRSFLDRHVVRCWTGASLVVGQASRWSDASFVAGQAQGSFL